MPQVVQVPSVGAVEFPDDMTDDQISSAIQRNTQAPIERADTRRLFDPALEKDITPILTELESSARQGGIFGSPTLNARVSDILPGGDVDQVQKGKDRYNQARDNFANTFNLTTTEADDYLKHKFGLQKEGVSKDSFDQIHIKDETLIKPISEIRKDISASNLPDDVKSKYTAEDSPELDLKITGFKNNTVQSTIKNHPELASSLGLTGDEKQLDQDFAKITGALNQGATSQGFGGAAAGFLRSVAEGSGVAGQMVGSEVSRGTTLSEEELRRPVQDLQKRQESINQLSAQLNEDKTKLFGTDAANIGGGLYSAAESVAVTAATGGLAAELVPMRYLPTIGKTVKAAMAVQPVSALYATRQASDTYKQAIEAGKTPEEAQDLAAKAFGIEWGFTTLFSAVGAGGLEDIGTRIGQETVKKSLKGAAGTILKDSLGENAEEGLINLFQTVAVDAKLNPNLTLEDLKKRAIDTAIATTLSTGPTAGGVELFHHITTPTHEQTTEELHDNADKIYTEKVLSENQDSGGNVETPSKPSVVTRGELEAEREKRIGELTDPEEIAALKGVDLDELAKDWGVELSEGVRDSSGLILDEKAQEALKAEETPVKPADVVKETKSEPLPATKEILQNDNKQPTTTAPLEVPVPAVSGNESATASPGNKPISTAPELPAVAGQQTQTVTNNENATQEGNLKEGNLGEHPNGDQTRQATETGSSDSAVSGSKGQEVEVKITSDDQGNVTFKGDGVQATFQHTPGEKIATLDVLQRTTGEKGSGIKLLTQAETELSSRGVEKIEGVADNKPALLKLYTDNGYVVTGTNKDGTVNISKDLTQNEQNQSQETTAPPLPVPQVSTGTETSQNPEPASSNTEATETAKKESEAPVKKKKKKTAKPKVEEKPDLTKTKRPLPPRVAPSKTEVSKTTSVKNAAMEADLKRLGLNVKLSEFTGSDVDNHAIAAERLKKDPEAGAKLLAKLHENPNALESTADSILLTLETAKRKKAVEDALAEVDKASPEERDAAEADAIYAERQFDDISQIAKDTGSLQGALLRARQLAVAEDFSLAALRQKVRKAKGSKTLTADESAQVKDLQKKIEAETKKSADLAAENAQLKKDAEVASKVQYLEEKHKPSKERVKNKQTQLNDRIDRARKRMRQRMSQTNAGVDLTILGDLATIGVTYLQKGAISLNEFTNKLVAEFGEKFRKYAEPAYNKAKELHGEQIQINPDKPLDPETIYALAKQSVINGKRGDEVLTDVHAQVAAVDPKITQDEVADAFLEHGKSVAQNKNELRTELLKVKSLSRLNREIVALNRGDKPKTERGQRLKDEQVQNLTRQRNQLKRDLGITESNEAALMEASRKRTEKLQQKMRDKDFAPEVKPVPRAKSKELLDQQTEEAKVKQEFTKVLAKHTVENQSTAQKVFNKLGTPLREARTLVASMDLPPVLRQGLATTLARPNISAKNFGRGVSTIFSEQNAEREKARIKNDPNYELATQAGLSLTDTGDATQKQLEEEFQGTYVKKLWPVKASERNYVTYMNGVRMDYFNALVSSLGVTDKKQAKAIANFVNVVTGRGNLGQFEQAATNLATVFFSPRFWASRIQMGYGMLKAAGDAATLFKTGDRDTVAARKVIAKEYARMAVAYGIFMTLLSAAGKGLTDDDEDKFNINFDSTSSEFLKAKIGKTRFDTTGGLSGNMVFLSRMLQGKSTNTAGEIKDFRGSSDYYRTIMSYLRGKIAPVPGAAINYKIGEDVVGKKTTGRSEIVGSLLPMSPTDIYEQFKEYGPVGAFGTAGLTLLGAGGNTYDNDLSPKQKIAIMLGDEAADFRKTSSSSRPHRPSRPSRPTR